MGWHPPSVLFPSLPVPALPSRGLTARSAPPACGPSPSRSPTPVRPTPTPGRRAARLLAAATLVGCTVAAGAGAPGAGADPLADADATVTALRRDADQASQAYFDALARLQALDVQAAEIEARTPGARGGARRAPRCRRAPRGRRVHPWQRPARGDHRQRGCARGRAPDAVAGAAERT